MNKKIKTYILIVAVIVVWGTISYKFINGFSDQTPLNKQANVLTKFKPALITKQDTFTIQPLDRDPFLGILKTKKKPPKKIIINTKKTTPLPQITYSGLIKNKQFSEEIFVVNINSAQYLMKTNETVDKIKLIRGNNKSIKVRFENRIHTILAQ